MNQTQMVGVGVRWGWRHALGKGKENEGKEGRKEERKKEREREREREHRPGRPDWARDM